MSVQRDRALESRRAFRRQAPPDGGWDDDYRDRLLSGIDAGVPVIGTPQATQTRAAVRGRAAKLPRTCGACRYAAVHALAPHCSCCVGGERVISHTLSIFQPACELYSPREADELTLHVHAVPAGPGLRVRRRTLSTCASCRYAVAHATEPFCTCALSAKGGSGHRLSLFETPCQRYDRRVGPDLTLHVFGAPPRTRRAASTGALPVV
jgi:hypothetical protein